LPRAASRAGLASKIVRRPVIDIDVALLPAILLLKGNEACILIGWEGEGGARQARLLFPEAGQGEIRLSQAELLERYLGIAIFCRPRFAFDARAPQVG
jgi:ATP-binding cassette subfamily C protein LapB